MDALVLVIVIVVATPPAVVWALAKSAQLGGPAVRRETRRPVGPLFTEAIPEPGPVEDKPESADADYRIDSPRADPDPDLRSR